jgi:hypothetical protein
MKAYHRNDNKLHENKKMVAAGCAALGLWTLCRSWAADNWSDGFIPERIVKRFSSRGSRVDLHVAKLVEVGLWEPTEGGWQMHDYADWNMTVAERDAEREAAKIRMRRVRATPPDATSDQPAANLLPTSDQPGHNVTPKPAGDEDLFGRTSQQRSRRTSRTGVTTSLQRANPAELIVQRWLRACEEVKYDPTSDTRVRLRKEIDKLLRQGYPADMIERAVAEWHRLNLNAATLPSIFDQLQRGTAPRFATATADARAQNTLELGASLIARGIE